MRTADKELCELDVANVHVSKQRVRRDVGNLEDLKLSIERFGLLHPIAVKQSQDGYTLIAGERRLTVAKSLGVKRIMAQVYNKLSPVDELDLELEENLRRDNLNPMDLAEAFKRRKLLYESEHPETKVGSTGGGRNGSGVRMKSDLSGDDKPAVRFTKAASERFDVSETTVKELIQLNDLPTSQKTALRNGAITKTEALRKVRSCARTANSGRRDKDEAGAVKPNADPNEPLLRAVFELDRELRHSDPKGLSPLCIEKLSGIIKKIRTVLQATDCGARRSS
jgi:ParB family transcriptional regulator, chromosome partitioning protein